MEAVQYTPVQLSEKEEHYIEGYVLKVVLKAILKAM